ncbi:predicted protein [Plenodomus lingam JN3]|uniref:Predicted protein n=1 Tax=Leptosphaeria maculans (strain JN3 / isolate v23.1.3 / race Av1-4-5-6-7-8) TaxID=985895 RepID=E5A5A2_LEPMJ|nr:predicted protein [Plenodomus lingam JN3]CBX98800.1 predicted protein [Plenodomus lingam JN3]
MTILHSLHKAAAFACATQQQDDTLMCVAIAGKLPSAADLAIGRSTDTRTIGLLLET